MGGVQIEASKRRAEEVSVDQPLGSDRKVNLAVEFFFFYIGYYFLKKEKSSLKVSKVWSCSIYFREMHSRCPIFL